MEDEIAPPGLKTRLMVTCPGADEAPAPGFTRPPLCGSTLRMPRSRQRLTEVDHVPLPTPLFNDCGPDILPNVRTGLGRAKSVLARVFDSR